jgi:hypothetical protein
VNGFSLSFSSYLAGKLTTAPAGMPGRPSGAKNHGVQDAPGQRRKQPAITSAPEKTPIMMRR